MSKYYYWGPLLYNVKLDKNFCSELQEKGSKSKKDHRKNLAGLLDKELQYSIEDKEWFCKKLKPYLDDYKNVFVHWYNLKEPSKQNFYDNDIILEDLWINFMKPSEFNPPHTHSGDLSFVIYTQMPKQITKENEDYKKNINDRNVGPGAIIFKYGDERKLNVSEQSFMPEECDMFIFPNNLTHWVCPYKSDVERVSVSGNLILNNLGHQFQGK